MNRVALYASGHSSKAQCEGLLDCARQAKAAGERVVTLATEMSIWRPEQRGEAVLKRLLARMAAGEFDVIIASFTRGDVAALDVIRLTHRDGVINISPAERLA